MLKKLLVYILFILLTICWATEDRKFGNNDEINTKYSIGINYSPLAIDISKASGGGFSVTYLTEANASIESYIQYSISNKLSTYFSLYYKDSDTEYYYSHSYTNNADDLLEGYKINSHTTAIKPVIGLKYYLISPQIKAVSPLISFGVGKQFFNIKYHRFDFPDKSLSYEVIKDTENEYDEGINSPFIVQIGLGAEYYINKSLSFTVNTLYEYLKITSSYKYYTKGTVDTNWHDRIDRNITDEKINTIINIGLSLHF